MKKLSVLAFILMFCMIFAICVFSAEYLYEVKRLVSTEYLPLSLAVGIIVAVIIVVFVCVSYKRGIHGDTYPLSQYSKLDLRVSRDNFSHRTVIITRIPDPPSNKK